MADNQHRQRLTAALAVTVAMGVMLVGLVVAGPPVYAFDFTGPDPTLTGASGATAASTFGVRSFVLNPALMGYAGLGKRGRARGQARGLRLSVGMTLDSRRATTRRIGDEVEDTASSPLDPRVMPHVAAVGGLGLVNLTAGAWYEEKSGASVWFPGRDPSAPLVATAWDRQRYGSLAYDLRLHHFGMALAWRPLPWLGIGAAMGAQWLSLEHRRILATGVDGDQEEPRADLESRVALKARFVPLGLFGLVLRPVRWLRLGGSFEVSSVARLEGTARLQPTRPVSWALVPMGDASAALRLRMGWVLRAAVGVDLGRVSVDVAGSVTDRPSPKSLVADTPGLVVQPLSWQSDTVAVNQLPLGIVLRRRLALSASVRVAVVAKRLFLSAGYGFTQSSADPRFRSAAQVAPDRHLLALGVCFRRGPLQVDVGYIRVQSVVTASTGYARQTHLVDPTASVSIASRRQTLSGDLASATLTIHMDFSP
jgi:hypothetical protein